MNYKLYNKNDSVRCLQEFESLTKIINYFTYEGIEVDIGRITNCDFYAEYIDEFKNLKFIYFKIV